MADQVWDVLVVGAGPAGCAAAAAAVRTGAEVLLLDRAEFPRDKVCGDGIAAAALTALGEVGLDTDELVAGYRPIDRIVLTSPRGAVADRRAARASWVVPREVFDARLRAAVLARGVVGERHRVRRLTERGDHVDVDGRWRAGAVVVAAGAESALAPAGRAPVTAVGLRGYARTDLPDAQALVFADRGWPAYAWSFPIGDGWANVGYGELSASRPTRAHLLDRLTALTPGLQSAPQRLRGARLPLATRRPSPGDGRILVAGDAAALVNPLSGEGIYDAVRSGLAAGRAAVTGDPVAAYRLALGAGRWHRRHASVLTRALRHAPGLLDAGLAEAARDQRSFDELVDLALTEGTLSPAMLARTGVRLLRGRRPG